MTKKFLFFLSLISFQIYAQTTPQPSPGASFTQTVGITKISVEYSRPGVKNRTIFGGLLPYGNVWRTGANDPTTIEFSNNIIVNGMPLSAGKYAIMSFPNKEEWTVVFSNNLETTQDTYNEADDELRIKVKPYRIPFTETFTIGISDVSDEMAKLNIQWENTGVALNLAVNNESTIITAIDQKNMETAGAFQQAAEYLLNKNLDLSTAMDYIEKSIYLHETFRNTWIKSVILRKVGKNSEALKFAVKAQQLGANDPVYSFFKEPIEKAITELKASLPAGN